MVEIGVWFSQSRSRVPLLHGLGSLVLVPHAMLLRGTRLFGPLPPRRFMLTLASEPACITLPYSMIRCIEAPRFALGYHHLWGWAGPTVIDLVFLVRVSSLAHRREFYQRLHTCMETGKPVKRASSC